MRHLRSTALRIKGLVFLYIALGVTAAFLQAFSASYFQQIVDRFTNGALTASAVALYGCALIALYLSNYLEEYPARTLEHGISLSLKLGALRKVSTIDYRAYTALGTGAIIQRIENGAQAGMNMLFGFFLRMLGELLPSMLFSVLFVFSIDRTVMLAIVAGYGVVFLVTNLLLKALYRVKERILVNEEAFNRLIVRGFMEMVVFRVHRRFGAEIRKAEAATREITSSKVKMKMIHEAFFTSFAVLVSLIKIGILIYGWEARALTIGQIVALIALIDNAYTPIAIFNVLYIDYKLDRVAFRRFTDFLDAPDDSHLLTGESVSSVSGEIAFSDASYRYEGREALTDFSLDIARGRTVALVGESGSGKSTAVKLLAGLLHPAEGAVSVDGKDLDGIDLQSYYAHIAYLPQEPAVFDGTLRENLAFDEPVPDERLLEALTGAGLLPLYGKLEHGLETPLGERGVALSGGERQQIALARLWFTRARIVIFDEATSAIDNLTEEAVMKNVLQRLAGRTVVAVAHRLDSIRGFDEIVVMRNGRIVERGTFGELLDRAGAFRELYDRSPQ